MLERSALKSVLMARFVTNSVDHQISFHTPPMTANYLCFRGFLLYSNKKFVFPIRVDCLLFLVFSKIVEPNNQNDKHSALKLRVKNSPGVRGTKKPLGIKLHMMPSPEIHPGLHCLELTSLHHCVDN